MRKLLLAFALAATCGCDDMKCKRPRYNKLGNTEHISPGLGYGIVIFTYKGHEYMANYTGGIIHSESCPCKKGGAE